MHKLAGQLILRVFASSRKKVYFFLLLFRLLSLFLSQVSLL